MDSDLYSGIERWLINTAMKLLECPEEEVSYDTDIDEIGFESLTKNKLFLTLNETFQLDLVPSMLLELEDQTLEELGDYLVENHDVNIELFFNNTYEEAK